MNRGMAPGGLSDAPVASSPSGNNPAAITFATQGVQPPSRIYCRPDDRLFITTWSNVATLAVTINTRTLRADGEIIPSQFVVNTAGARTPTTSVFALPEGFLLSIGVTCPNAANPAAYTYATVGLFRGNTAASNQYEGLFCGYVCPTLALGYPESPSQRPTDGEGTIRSISGSTPAAGAEINEVVPTNARWKLLAFSYQLVTSATVANRQSSFLIDDGSHVLIQRYCNTPQAASGTFTYNWASYGFDPAAINQVIPNSFPQDLPLPAGFRLRTLTANIAAGDQYSAPQYLVREWLENI